MPSNNSVNTSLSGQTGKGAFVGSTSPILITPTLGAASATSIAFSSTTGIVGTTTNNNAASGSVGEYVSSMVSSSPGVSLTSTVAANVTSISLTAGDWDLMGNVTLSASGSFLDGYGWISITSATPPDASMIGGFFISPSATIQMGFSVPYVRLSLSGTTTVYLSTRAEFAAGTGTACGGIFARRRR